MNSTVLSFEKARSIAAHLRTNRRHGRGWTEHTDRDLVREAQEVYLIAQSSHPRMF